MGAGASQLDSSCLACGACCAFFRVSFHWSETLSESFGVPGERAEGVNAHFLAMRGTNQPTPRCEALEGALGDCVNCAIYENRPSPCRDFRASDEPGGPNPDCDRARASIGLAPLRMSH